MVSRPAAVAWPSPGYEERPWKPDPWRGPYRAAVVPEIAAQDPVTESRTQALVEEATIAMVRFDAEMGRNFALEAMLLRSEAACSSRIENLAAGAREVALARLGDTSSNAASLIASNVRALQAAIELSEDLTADNVVAVHHALLRSSDHGIAGKYRDAQVWIRGNSPHTAEFVPPHPDRVLPAMEDLVAFMRRDDIPALTQAAIAHAQFETIHPFADGNGRTGRALVSALLRAKGVTENVTLPVSSGLLTDTRLYFDALGAYREGAIQPIVERFAESALWAVDNGGHLAADIRIAEKDFESRLSGAPRSALKLVRLLPGEPAVTADMMRGSNVSTATAYRAIQWLERAAILEPAGKIRGTSVWVAPELITALDVFCDRSVRSRRP